MGALDGVIARERLAESGRRWSISAAARPRPPARVELSMISL